MATSEGSVQKRIERSLYSWLVDFFIEHWPAVVTAIITGGGMTYLATISSWLEAYGPVGYGAAGLLSVLVVCLIYFIYAIARERIWMTEYIRRKSETSSAHVLAPIHEFEKINLSDFFHPFYRPTSHARFENCDLMGPAMVVADGCVFSQGGFNDCEIVIVNPTTPIRGAMRFNLCTFVRCNLFRVTFLMNREQYDQFPPEFRAKITVISGNADRA